MGLLHSLGRIHSGASNPLLRLTQIILLNDAAEGIRITCDGCGKITRILEGDGCLDAFVTLTHRGGGYRSFTCGFVSRDNGGGRIGWRKKSVPNGKVHIIALFTHGGDIGEIRHTLWIQYRNRMKIIGA